jgi:hypothetical protein
VTVRCCKAGQLKDSYEMDMKKQVQTTSHQMSVLAFILFIPIAFTVTGCGRTAAKAPEATEVTVATPIQQDVNHNLAYCYNDARVIRWLWQQAKRVFRGGAHSFE